MVPLGGVMSTELNTSVAASVAVAPSPPNTYTLSALVTAAAPR